ncbi:MAG: hypothetical protein UR12_C0026G0024 [candidate division TM6 bacterium GW2011_GWF2_30_66]|nr:MAG: hypothetical protein UR12_C0026G0024 [candidate division TM6 bacterium GW2011_GWF2_30_66]
MQKKTTLLSIVTLASLITTQLSAINFSYLFPKKQPASSPIIKYISSNPKTIMAITSAAIAMPVAAYLYIKRNDVACYLTSTKLLLACKSGNLDLVKSILSNCNEDIVNKVNYNNETPLFWACLINNPAMIRILIANGAKKSINTASSKTGNTPLSLTLYNDNLKMMKFLLDNGADINQSILMHSTTVLKIACDNTNFNAVKFLVENGADINKADIYGQTPLFIASAEKSINIVKYLLDNSANIDIANIKGETPFSFACDDNNIELMELLLLNGANINTSDIYGFTPLLWAIISEEIGTIKYLVSHSADVNLPNSNCSTPLFWACQINNLEIVKYLIENGAQKSINELNDYGTSALDVACQLNNEEMIEYLIKHGATTTDYNIKLIENENLKKYFK